MKVFGWLADISACGFYRVILPLGALRQYGIETSWSNRFREADWEADIVIAQRTHQPGPTQVLEEMMRSKAPHCKLVYELDDDLWSIPPSNRPAHTYHQDNPEARENMIRCIRIADLVTVTTEPLAEVIRQWNPRVLVLPNYIPAQLLSWRHGEYVDRLTVGWQGSPTHDGDWSVAARALGQWWRERSVHRAMEFHLLGSVPPTFPESVLPRVTAPTPVIDDYYRRIDWHFGLAPLASNRFNESKSHLRVLEAAALGIPMVASDVPAYQVVREQEMGLLAKPGADWRDKLDQMLDPQARQAMSDNAYTYAARNTIEHNVWRWRDAFEELLK